MTTKAPTIAKGGGTGFSITSLAASPDAAIAFSVIGIILMMIFPLPSFLLDMLLATSLSISVIILLVSVYITKPLDFGVFPTVLLLTTLFRLALNVATTRSILLHGADSHSLSKLIQAFGDIVIGGNFLVGFVIFLILMIINFVVITKGSGRIAEVAARFTLDAMPGKQMAIDAELQNSHITAEEARKRRKAVENEADFYGSMDGASKFVRGDAIAGLIITAINMLVGLLVGVVQHGMPVGDAAKTFTTLAVGDGLISALPALMVSTAAGLIVTRATSEGNLGAQVFGQIKIHPKAFYISGGLIGFLALLPGFPTLAFLALAGFIIFLGRLSEQSVAADALAIENAVESEEKQKDAKDADSLDAAMKIDILAVEVGHGLVSLIDPQDDGEVVQRIQSMRKQFAQDLGFIVPQVQLRDNLQLGPGEYQILLKGNKIAGGSLMVDYFLAMDPGSVELPIDGEPTQDPVYGLNAIWVTKHDKDDANFRGYTVVNCATVIATHLNKLINEHAYELLTRQDVQYLVDRVKDSNPKVVEEVLHPERLAIGDVVKVMQNLLKEEVSVRDILTILETLADYCKTTRNPDVLSEFTRKALSRTIVQKHLNENEEILIVTFDKRIEDILSGALGTTEAGSTFLNLNAQTAHEILGKLDSGLKVFDTEGTRPIVVLSSRLRSAFQKVVVRYIPHVLVLGHDEIPLGYKIRNLAMIS